jgi:ATP-binding cassette subfamily F protein 3
MILVSHDRYFLQGLADKIYEFRDGKVGEFLGGIDDYLEARKFDDFRQVEQKEEQKQIAKKTSSSNGSYEDRKQADKDIRKAGSQVQKLETEIEALESVINDLDERLQDPEEFKEISKDPDFYAKYEKQKADLQQLMEEWETWQQKLSKAEKRRQELDG